MGTEYNKIEHIALTINIGNNLKTEMIIVKRLYSNLEAIEAQWGIISFQTRPLWVQLPLWIMDHFHISLQKEKEKLWHAVQIFNEQFLITNSIYNIFSSGV